VSDAQWAGFGLFWRTYTCCLFGMFTKSISFDCFTVMYQ
jgi:hypothetical protein